MRKSIATMATRHSMADPRQFTHQLDSALASLPHINPSIAYDARHRCIYRCPGYAPLVSIVASNGSGHLPGYHGFVGDGLLTACVSGLISAAPNVSQIRRMLTTKCESSRGVLCLVPSSDADILSFGLALEHAETARLDIRTLTVSDDVATGRGMLGNTPRRSQVGMVLVMKIAGALAAAGADLDDVYRVAKLASENIVSVGTDIGHINVRRGTIRPDDVPAKPSFSSELSRGTSSEPGADDSMKVRFQELIKHMLKQLLDVDDRERNYVTVNSNEVVLLINNFGDCNPKEVAEITIEVVTQLARDYNIKPVRIYTGAFLTELDRHGFSICILNVMNTDIGGPSMLQLLDAPSEATGWFAPIRKETWETREEQAQRAVAESLDPPEIMELSGPRSDAFEFERRLKAGLYRLIAAEADLARFEVGGDGTGGRSLIAGANAILELLFQKPCTGYITADLARILQAIERVMDGALSSLCGNFLNSLIACLGRVSDHSGLMTPQTWSAALENAYQTLARYSQADRGSCTFMGALLLFIESLESSRSLRKAAEVAKLAAEHTERVMPKNGACVNMAGDTYERFADLDAWAFGQFVLGLAGAEDELVKPNNVGDNRSLVEIDNDETVRKSGQAEYQVDESSYEII